VIKSTLLHPKLLEVLASSGHGSKILIADGNYPFVTRANPAAERVYLNLAQGVLNVIDVLDVLLTVIPIESAHVMLTDDGSEPSIHIDFRQMLSVPLEAMPRQNFYQLAHDPDCSLVIATAEQRLYANIILTIGVIN
jgi:L-fucose mutarotase